MKRYPILLLLLSLFSWGHEPVARPVRPVLDFCELKGQVFIEQTPGFADYRVYLEDTEAFAELLVYQEDVSSFASEPGYWYFTDVKGFADFSIYLEPTSGFADFSIAYTDFRASAGCK